MELLKLRNGKSISKSEKSIKDKDLIFWRLFFFLSIIVALVNIFDGVTTYFALKIQGTYESNPLMRHIINDWGWFAFFVVKTLFIYLALPLKFCPMYYFINLGIKNKTQIIGMLIMFVILMVYLFLAYGFLKISLGNLQHIL